MDPIQRKTPPRDAQQRRGSRPQGLYRRSYYWGRWGNASRPSHVPVRGLISSRVGVSAMRREAGPACLCLNGAHAGDHAFGRGSREAGALLRPILTFVHPLLKFAVPKPSPVPRCGPVKVA